MWSQDSNSFAFVCLYIMESAKHWLAFKFCMMTVVAVTVLLNRTLHPECKYAYYFSAVRYCVIEIGGCWADSRVVAMVCVWHRSLAMYILMYLYRKDRFCLMCKSSQHMLDKHHFLFYCPVYSLVWVRHASLLQQTSQCQCSRCEANASGHIVGHYLKYFD